MTNWINMELGKAISFNPPEKLSKKQTAKKVVMEKLAAHQKKITGFEIAPYNGGAKFRNGDTLLAKITPSLENGKTAQVDILEENEVGFGSTEFIVLRGSDHTINDFVFYLAKSPAFRKKAIGCMEGTSGRKRVNDKALKLQVLPIPDLPTQQKIAAVLSALDAKIELNWRIKAEMESMVKTLYDYWFVQFDFPNEKGKPYKSAGGKMVWNEELKRDVPAGWEVTELRKYVTSNRGVSYSGKDITGGGIPMVNLNSFNVNSTYKPEGIKTYSGEYNATKILKPFDLVMCNTQQTALDPEKDIIGKSFLIPDIFESDIVSSHHVTTITVNKEPLKYYLNSLFNSEYFHRYISGYATGTNILGLNFEGVLSYRTAIPSDNLLERYKSIVINVEKQKSRIIKENQTLTELRDWLLPMLMNGQVKVD